MKVAEKLANNIAADVEAFLHSCSERCAALAAEILEGTEPLGSSKAAAAGELLPSERAGTQLIYRVVSGEVSLRINNRSTFIFEPGDAVGLGAYHEREDVELAAEVDSQVDVFRSSDVLEVLDSDAALRRSWTELCAQQTFIMQCVVAGNIIAEMQHLAPRTVIFKAGKTIFKEGSRAPDFFVLLEGQALASANGRPVGTLREDEVFGAIAAMLQQPRATTVTAISECKCLRYLKDEFPQLISDCPGIAMRMVDSMSQAVAASEQRIVR